MFNGNKIGTQLYLEHIYSPWPLNFSPEIYLQVHQSWKFGGTLPGSLSQTVSTHSQTNRRTDNLKHNASSTVLTLTEAQKSNRRWNRTELSDVRQIFAPCKSLLFRWSHTEWYGDDLTAVICISEELTLVQVCQTTGHPHCSVQHLI